MYTLYGVKVDTDFIPVTGSSHDPGTQEALGRATGGLDASFGSFSGTRSLVTFVSPAMRAACNALGMRVEVTVAAPVILYYALLDDVGGYASGSVHSSVTINSGLLRFVSATGTVGSRGMVRYELTVSWDGSNDPFVISNTVALPTVTQLEEDYRLYCVRFTGDTVQLPVAQCTVSSGITATQDRAASTIHPTFAAEMSERPMATMSTPAVKSAIDLTGVDAVADTEVVVYFAKRTSAGIVLGATGLGFSLNVPLVTLTNFGARQDGRANASIRCFATYDEGAPAVEPLTIDIDTTPPAAVALTELYTLGPADYDVAAEPVNGWTLSINHDVVHQGHSGEFRPTYAGVTGRETTIEVDAEEVNGVTAAFGQSVSGAVFYLRKIDENGTRVANATAEHIKVTVAEGLLRPGRVDGAVGEISGQALTVFPTVSGANDPVLISTTSAIT